MLAPVQSRRTPQLKRDVRVDDYQIIRLLGRGGMGEVYLALDTRLGRKVALKVIHPEQMSSRDAVERFLFEAQATAAFNHPNIITIYGAGESQGLPYVALEYLPGQDLRQRMGEGPIGLREGLRIMLAVSSALAEAHRHGLLHRDLKPDNVLIAVDGTLRVVDFGLAKAIDRSRWADAPAVSTSAGGWVGSPPYMAPEQWLCRRPTAATDVWALGVMLFELVTGSRPYADVPADQLAETVTGPESAPALGRYQEVPLALADLVNRCLAKDPQGRPSASEIVVALQGLLAEGGRRRSDEVCPFPGLLPFAEDQAAFFFGREAEVLAFLERLRREAVLPVVGLSGAGKSSFVRAGVIPRLRDQGPWVVLQLRPGRQPFRTLAGRLLGAFTVAQRNVDTMSTVEAKRSAHPAAEGADGDGHGGDVDQLMRQLSEDPLRLGLVLRKLADAAQSRVVLFVDQLEELYSLVDDAAVRSAFVRSVCAAADDGDDPVRVVFTLRDDFLVPFADTAEARQVLRHLTVLRMPDKSGLAQALREPLLAVGYDVDDSQLVDEMVGALRGEPASLPVLQFAARMLWEERDRNRRCLRRASYEAIGGVEGALATHADGVLRGLAPGQREIARQLMLRLVTPHGTRLTLSHERLLQGLAPEAADVLTRLTDARLVTTRPLESSQHGDGVELELIHESLITHWATLGRWISEGRHEVAHLADLEQAAELWSKRGRRPQEVWQDEALKEVRKIVERHAATLSPSVLEFVAVAETQARRRQTTRRALLAVTMVGLAALAAASMAVAWALATNERRARQQQRIAEAQRSVALREGARAALRQGQVLEARAKLRLSLEGEDSTFGRALWWRLGHDPRRWTQQLPASVHDVAFSPDGTHVAAACQDGTVYLLNARTRRKRAMGGLSDQVFGVAFSPDGTELAAGTRQGEVWLWNIDSGQRKLLGLHRGPVRRVRFSPDGKYLASAGWDKVVHLWPVHTAGPARAFEGHEDRVYGIDFSPDGRWLASGGYDKTVRIWSTESGKLLRILRGHEDRVFSVAFGPRGRLLASGSWDRTVRVWDPRTGKVERLLQGHPDGVSAVRFAGDGRLLITGCADKTIRVWDLDKATVRRTLRGHQAGIAGIALDGRGHRLASASYDKTVRIWDLTAAGRTLRRVGHTDRVNGVAFSRDGRWLASASSDQTVRLWDVESGVQRHVLRGHDNGVIRAVFSPDGKLLASAGWDNAIRIWNLDSGTQQHVLLGHTGEIHDLQFASGGRQLLSASWDGTIRVWDIGTGAQREVVLAHRGGVRAIRLSPDGQLLASAGGDRVIHIWDTKSGRRIRSLAGHEGTVTSVSFSPDGKRLASASYDKTVRLWDLKTGASRIVGRHVGRVYKVAFHPGGNKVGSAGAEGDARIWNLDDGEALTLKGHHGTVNDFCFSRSGELAATCGDDGSVRLWSVPTGKPVWRSTVVASRLPQLRTHRGWVWHNDSAAVPQQALVHARNVDVRGKLMCVKGDDDTFELWVGRRRAMQRVLPGLERVLAHGAACVALAKGRVRHYTAEGWVSDMGNGVKALSVDGSQLLLVSDTALKLFDGDGKLVGEVPVPAGATAVTRLRPGAFVLGLQSGGVMRVGAGAADGSNFADTPASAVTRMLRGPRGMLIVGFANGLVGLWDDGGGPRLDYATLHGPVIFLAMGGSRLHVATELGDHWRWDLGPFFLDYCPFLQRVWAAVPVVWQRGAAVVRRLPVRHRCAVSKEPR